MGAIAALPTWMIVLFSFLGGMVTIGTFVTFYGKVAVRLSVPTLKNELGPMFVSQDQLTAALRSAIRPLEEHKVVCDQCRASLETKIRTEALNTFHSAWADKDSFFQERFRSMQEYLDSTNREMSDIRSKMTTALEGISYIRGKIESIQGGKA